MHPKLGLWGLLAFEAVLAAYLLGSFGLTQYVVMAALGAGLLALALVLQRGSPVVPPWLLSALAAVTLWRAMAQTVGVAVPPTAYATYAVPLGFAIAAFGTWRGAWRLAGAGLAVMGLARAFFILSYVESGVMPIAVANVFGAAGALAWAWGTLRAPPEEAPEVVAS